MAKPTVVELCAGAGGQALGLEQAGFEHVALIDNDPHPCATLRINRPYWNVIEADIIRLDFKYWHGTDIVAAGLPCPPFSVAGKQFGADDERDLFPTLLRAVKEIQPHTVLVENVRGLMFSRFEKYRQSVRSELEHAGYNVHWHLLDAFDFGAPQHRTRSFLVATLADSFSWPTPNGGGGTVGKSLLDLMSENGWKKAAEWAVQADQPAPTLVGGSHKHGGPDLGPTRARRAWAELGVDGLGLSNGAPEPDFEGAPRLTVRMTARLQTFPDEWQFAGRKTHQYRQVGNALPVSLSAAVASSISKCL